ncbi:tRNA glutamyl-Q(34) synthetase GluQRS [Undibacterium rugosum]|uniref:tRNA glutamyl-Q(34) synthetase GluQRS n=1 Tax=Undibacterium rugosum TaxID=2762291 RepID=UPI001B8332BC|nr:tRNA glutamyl-Q(34) synthetase GluQRS [Undibacterium rugosum]MBR7778464.1 tRNA glutamyl-Q(34) synthetase GluQRS [Undibacterium rugosum]
MSVFNSTPVASDTCVTSATSTNIVSPTPGYTGRFAPSPTGPLHLGSLVAAMASYLDARAHQGRWLLRIEDLDFDRNVADADRHILNSLQRCGMHWDGDVSWQSQRQPLYEQALKQLAAQVYPCACSRKEIADSRLRAGSTASQIYPGTCRTGLAPGKAPRAWRLRVPDGKAAVFQFEDRLLGAQTQDLASEVGDFVLKRADGFWAYQLAVVVDDAEQGISHVVRGADLLDSTARQCYLQQLLGLPRPAYLHVPVVTNADGEKLSKQTGALAFDRGDNDVLQEALLPAARFLGLQMSPAVRDLHIFWESATAAWAQYLARQPAQQPIQQPHLSLK